MSFETQNQPYGIVEWNMYMYEEHVGDHYIIT